MTNREWICINYAVLWRNILQAYRGLFLVLLDLLLINSGYWWQFCGVGICSQITRWVLAHQKMGTQASTVLSVAVFKRLRMWAWWTIFAKETFPGSASFPQPAVKVIEGWGNSILFKSNVNIHPWICFLIQSRLDAYRKKPHSITQVFWCYCIS